MNERHILCDLKRMDVTSIKLSYYCSRNQYIRIEMTVLAGASPRQVTNPIRIVTFDVGDE